MRERDKQSAAAETAAQAKTSQHAPKRQADGEVGAAAPASKRLCKARDCSVHIIVHADGRNGAAAHDDNQPTTSGPPNVEPPAASSAASVVNTEDGAECLLRLAQPAAPTPEADQRLRRALKVILAKRPAENVCEEGARCSKRARRPREWGKDVVVYTHGGGGAEGAQDLPSPATTSQQAMDVNTAAGVLMSLRRPVVNARAARWRARQASGAAAKIDEPAAATGRTATAVGPSNRTKEVKKAVKKASVAVEEPKACLNCGATETPTWRRAGGRYPLCNACGVHRATRGTDRVPPTPPSARK